MADVNSVNSYKSPEEYIKENYSHTTTEQITATQSKSDKDMFLQLLVTQMQYQDPLDPQDNSEFLSQMAQFTSLEQMQNINQSTEMNLATGMIGKIVTGTDSDGKAVLGMVEGARMISGSAYLRVEGKDIPINNVTAVTAEINASDVILDYTKASYASSLVGKVITAKVIETDEEGNETTKSVQGIVANSKIANDGKVYVVMREAESGIEKDISIDKIETVTEMIPAEEEILGYVGDMSTNISSLIGKLEEVISQLGALTNQN